ncbi:MAG: right-handed parallel beta-helix repeat-containing protein [Verrucomicrobia bacterium]|nr:right-handed parallel beta-helix repeat-containing protein [Verrucomicrobiota bacterium]
MEEITQPGEWYLDRANGILYLWPPVGFSGSSEVIVSVASSILSVSSAKHIRFLELTLEAARKTLFMSWKSVGIELRNLVLRNTGSAGASIHGTDSLVSRCDVHGTGRVGIVLSGGDRSTLTLGNNRVEDCEIHDVGRTQISGAAGLEIADCGNIVRHNLIHHAPRNAITYRGNEHAIEFNELHSVCLGSSDSGAIYAPGDWGARGVKIRFNYIHDIRNDLGSSDVHGIYLDETNAGALVESNLLYGVAGYAFKINGGRDNLVRHNVVAYSGGVLFASDWGLRQLNTPSMTSSLQTRLQNLINLGYQQEPWLTRYPECAAIPRLWSEVSASGGRWVAPEGNELVGNFSFANKQWYSYDSFMGPDPVTEYFRSVGENIQATASPFIDETGGDLRLKINSQVFTIPGFKDIPFDEIGIRP